MPPIQKPKHVPKPDWLKIKLGDNDTFTRTKSIVERHCLHTICTSGRCPNMGECWSRGTATFMIAGGTCTRACRFCNTPTGKPLPLDPEEPQRLAESIRLMELKHAVVTSVDRDDLPDYGAQHWVNSIEAIRRECPRVTLEVLIPDFGGRADLVEAICATRPDVVSHNLETVRRLTPSVRHLATYDGSLGVLGVIAQSGLTTKTGIMLGLGETEQEVVETMDDALSVGVSVITIGQYLQPSRKQLPVVAYVHPDQFERLRQIGIAKGFARIESGPLVRSSYHAERHLIPSE